MAYSVFVSTAILSNALFMCFETDASMTSARARSEVADEWALVNVFFNVVFLIELSFRIVVLRTWFFAFEFWWNLLDFGLVTMSVIQMLAQSGNSIVFMRVLRGLRVVKIMRIIRVVRFFRELRIMVCSITSAMASLCWAFVLLFIILLLCSLIFVQAAAGHIRDLDPSDPVSIDLEKSFGPIGNAFWTLFLSISGGNDWGEFAESIAQTGAIYWILYVFFIIFVVFGVLNVLVGVFVTSSAEVQDKDLLIQQELMQKHTFIKEMKHVFRDFSGDDSEDIMIDWDQFRNHVANEEVQAYLESQQLFCGDMYRLFELLDHDNSGKLSLKEFILGCLHLKGTARCSDVVLLLTETRKVHKELQSCQRELEHQISSMKTPLHEMKDRQD